MPLDSPEFQTKGLVANNDLVSRLMEHLPQLRSPSQAHPAQDLAAGRGVGQGVVMVEQKDAVALVDRAR
jgi:hypothetical protein